MTIAIDAALCLKKKFAKATCIACMDICPSESISESLDVDKSCINCGLCLAKCPVEAIAGNSYGIEPIRQLIAKDSPIRLSCQKCQPDSPWPCLGFLDTTLLLTFVYSGQDTNREVTVYQKECEVCNSTVARHIMQAVEETNLLLGSEKRAIVNSNKKGNDVASQAISRRQFFAELWGASVSTVREVAFPLSDRLEAIPRRDFFLTHDGEKLIAHNIDNQTIFKSIVINNSCNACGLCVKICSKGAITTVLEDGIVEISHKPARCNNCGICAAKCPREAISIHSAKHLVQNLVLRACLPICTNCGEAYQPIGNNSLCIDCMQKIKLQSLSEQV